MTPAFTLTLSWTAPGDDGRAGRANRFDLRYSRTPITESNFELATPVPGMPTPGVPGTVQGVIVTGLDQRAIYYFALKTRDESGNWSAISNLERYPSAATTGVGDSPFALEFAAPWPNPAHTRARFALALPEPMEVEVQVFGVSGRRVRSLAGGLWPAGRREIEWDLRDAQGVPVTSGVYWVRARLGSRVWSRPVTVLR